MNLRNLLLTEKQKKELIKAEKQRKRGEELIKDAFARIGAVMHRVSPSAMKPGFYGPAKGYMLPKKLTHKQVLKKWSK